MKRPNPYLGAGFWLWLALAVLPPELLAAWLGWEIVDPAYLGLLLTWWPVDTLARLAALSLLIPGSPRPGLAATGRARRLRPRGRRGERHDQYHQSPLHDSSSQRPSVSKDGFSCSAAS